MKQHHNSCRWQHRSHLCLSLYTNHKLRYWKPWEHRVQPLDINAFTPIYPIIVINLISMGLVLFQLVIHRHRQWTRKLTHVLGVAVIGARQFFFSIRHGQVINKELLFAILHGTLDFDDVQNVLARQQASLLDTRAASTESSELHQKVWQICCFLAHSSTEIYSTHFYSIFKPSWG